MDSHSFTAQQIIETLELKPHVEGGYYSLGCVSALFTDTDRPGEARRQYSTIYYLLNQTSPVGYLHKNQSDIVHFFHLGSPIRYTTISPDGDLKRFILGNSLAQGELLQEAVRGGYWKGAELIQGGFALISELVCPGFDFRDMTLATRDEMRCAFPQHFDEIAVLVKD